MRTRIALLAGLLMLACSRNESAAPPVDGVAPAATVATIDSLFGEWVLVELQSSDESIGTIAPDSAERYTMTLGGDGRVAMRLDCNRGSGTWTGPTGVASASGEITFGPLAMTRAFCGEQSLDTRIAREIGSVASYTLRDGKLHLALKGDEGVQVWGRP